MISSELLSKITFVWVIFCWIVFALVFLLRKRQPNAGETKRDNKATLGVILEGVGYAVVWSIRRPLGAPIFTAGIIIESFVALFTALLAASSVWLVLAAVQMLGKQWAVAARLVGKHKLITEGPYALVRNPIYTGMFGMLIATGLAASPWYALVPAMIIFIVGTNIRVKAEENLLREAFKDEFKRYAADVPAYIPFARITKPA